MGCLVQGKFSEKRHPIVQDEMSEEFFRIIQRTF